MIKSNKNTYRFFVPEVVQTSGMDCGPASLKCIMEGLGVSTNYGRLREACQTDVDGTSIDTIEVVANKLGMEAEQIMLPPDHLFINSANVLPAMVIIELPNLATHFLVVWRTFGNWVQIMDPACGRTWKRKSEFLNDVYQHAMSVPADAWREWAGSEEFINPLTSRLLALGVSDAEAKALLKNAQHDSSYTCLATLDAAVRMVAQLISAKGVAHGCNAVKLLLTLLEQSRKEAVIPDHCWSVVALKSDLEESQLELRGAVALRVRPPQKNATQTVDDSHTRAESLERVLQEPQPSALKHAVQSLLEAGWLLPGLLIAALLVAGIGTLFEALLLRGLIDIGQELGAIQQRLGASAMLLVFAVGLLLIELPIAAGVLCLGRTFEARLRMAIYRKIPRLHDRYFQSRLISDMAERAHSLEVLKQAPLLAENALRLVFSLVFTTAGIIWLAPAVAHWAVLALVLAIVVPWTALTLMEEKDMQVRTHEGALSRFYLDALLGLTALRSHSAYKGISLEHEGMLVEWIRTGLNFRAMAVFVEGAQLAIGFGFAAVILIDHFQNASDSSVILLLTYWALYIPVLGQQLAQQMRQVPETKNRLLRLLEPLTAQEEFGQKVAPHASEESQHQSIAVALKNIDVVAAGNTILENINLNIPAGKHIAVVGPSGAGKSSLIGLLLGWHRPAHGQIIINGKPLDQANLAQLREQTVWIDPSVQLWNNSLINNICYGHSPTDTTSDFADIIEQADLLDVLSRLPEGMQTQLGESGRLISGGEGQRVRLARGLRHRSPTLVILDEAFRGLQKKQRVTLLKKLRAHWKYATFIHISHDIRDTTVFDEVVVLEQGRISEQGDPRQLLGNPRSRYKALHDADIALHQRLWRGERWRHWQLQHGLLTEQSSENA